MQRSFAACAHLATYIAFSLLLKAFYFIIYIYYYIYIFIIAFFAVLLLYLLSNLWCTTDLVSLLKQTVPSCSANMHFVMHCFTKLLASLVLHAGGSHSRS